MDMSDFRTESHVAQQIRRDRLRVQQSSALLPSLEGQFSGNADTSTANARAIRNANLQCGLNFVSPEIINLMNNSDIVGGSSFGSPSNSASTNFIPAIDDSSKQQETNWMALNYANSSMGFRGNQDPLVIGVPSNNLRTHNTSCQLTERTSYNEVYPEVQSSEMSNQYTNGKYEEMQLLRPGYRNFQVVTDKGSWELQMSSLVQHGGGELALLSVDGNTSSALNFDNSGNYMVSGVINNCQQWSGELGSNASKRSDGDLRTVVDDSTITQGLSLSLSSNNLSEVPETQPGQYPSPSNLSSYAKPCIMSVSSSGSSLQDILGTSQYIPRNSGPLGPFTGYATILKSSKFLIPAQQLLDEFCNVSSSKEIKIGGSFERIPGETCNAGEMTGVDRSGQVGSMCGTSYNCNRESGAGSCSLELCPPEYHQRKAKVLFMQDEVRRKYKQYHQQMQMVVSSFESVEGLSSATPYISRAFKTISRHFRSLKTAILDQINYITKAMGGNSFSPTIGVTSSNGNADTLRLNYLERTIKRQKSSEGNAGSIETQHVWRPQRGLPDRAVAILRAWLFDHFLHPYPTDTDKQILAAQTGLSRNQVSNWFINARVRVWKPMVEEIHMLETQNMADANQSCGKNEEKSTAECSGRAFGQHLNSYAGAVSNMQVESHVIGSSSSSRDGMDVDELNTDKFSRVNAQTRASIDGSVSFIPYQQGRPSSRVLGTVSLTLGPPHGMEILQHQQLIQQDDQLRQQFGGQILHDFVG